MNILSKTFVILTAAVGIGLTSQAQQTKAEKKAAKQATFKKLIEGKAYTFTAQNVSPLRGGTRTLTSEYDVRFTGDSVITYLPFFGRAYAAPINPNEGGIKFTSTKFDYQLIMRKNGNYDVIIKPQDFKEVRQLTLSVSVDGYGSLSVASLNRDPISFYGYLSPNNKLN